MQEVLKVPADTFDHFINEMPMGRMIYDRNYFGVPRSDAMTFIHFFFNTRPKELKAAFFEAVVNEVTRRAGLDRADLLMSITEVAAENWWAHGRTIDPVSGYDTRMNVDSKGNAVR
jgi:phenylpyruvate tautomerase PptA (4-oxalocrotonate tautomerase family)